MRASGSVSCIRLRQRKKGGLAAAAWPDDGGDLIGRDLHGDVVERLGRAEPRVSCSNLDADAHA